MQSLPQHSPVFAGTANRRQQKCTESNLLTCDETEFSARIFFEKLLYDFELDFVDFVDWSKFELGDDLGEGRNGIVYKTHLNGKDVAVKQFDLSKNFESYENEIKAYKYLKGAWGKHVPTPFFVSRSKSGQVAFLGMTMGKELSQIDLEQNGEVYWNQFLDKVAILERDFGFRHLDVWENMGVRNHIVVENGNVLPIDFESWEHKEVQNGSLRVEKKPIETKC